MRSSGILLPVFSLPGKYGIGGFTKEAYKFVDFLKAAGQKYWQILPLGPTGYGDSPYQSFSTFAGNPYFIDVEELVKEGLITEEECKKYDASTEHGYIEYEKLYLNRIFNNNEFVNLTFTNTDFSTVNGIKDVIGVQVKQEYLSSTYGDTGFLFLMVDLRGEKPVIHVRTWQPKETPVGEKIDANSFVFD